RTIDVRAGLWIPIVFRNESLGVISLSSTIPGAFTEADRDLMCSLANHIAIAISNFQRYRTVDLRLQSKVNDLAKLSHISQTVSISLQTAAVLQAIVQSTSEAFRSSSAAIVVLTEDQTELTVIAAAGFRSPQVGRRIPLGPSASGWV